VLHSLKGANGKYSKSGFIADTAGNLYGTADEGGAGSSGVVFRLAP
jgi:uncharacterized repeat protein (TIGR03803 family)